MEYSTAKLHVRNTSRHWKGHEMQRHMPWTVMKPMPVMVCFYSIVFVKVFFLIAVLQEPHRSQKGNNVTSWPVTMSKGGDWPLQGYAPLLSTFSDTIYYLMQHYRSAISPILPIVCIVLKDTQGKVTPLGIPPLFSSTHICQSIFLIGCDITLPLLTQHKTFPCKDY